MKWSIIYSVDTKQDNRIAKFAPENGKWLVTEQDDSYEFDYLGKDYEKGHHRKYCGYLSDKCFRLFLRNTLYPVFVELTGGMIGAPTDDGMNIGWMPAFSLQPELYEYDDPIFQDAYVCPIPDNKQEEEFLKSFSDETTMKKWIEESYL